VEFEAIAAAASIAVRHVVPSCGFWAFYRGDSPRYEDYVSKQYINLKVET
jgi:predicted GNAT family acetyltransferase